MLQKHYHYYDIAGIRLNAKNGKLTEHLGEGIDPQASSAINLKNFDLSEIKMIKWHGSQAPYGLKFVSQGEAPLAFDTTIDTHRTLSLELYEENYAKLAPNQQLIGVHGYFELDPRGDFITSFGLILKEEVTE